MHMQMHNNIGLGNPALTYDDDKVHEAAHLGGAEDFIDEFPNGFDTYLECPVTPVNDFHGDLPEGTTMFFGSGPLDLQISCGQVQRLAMYLPYIHALIGLRTESSAGMLLFDEPSASLDPTAEYEHLRKLKGNKILHSPIWKFYTTCTSMKLSRNKGRTMNS
ncbi:hypothetical protein BDR07DRAFT_1459419 [Suillus spraguei]|nr:hypothetical protein BDR07DRAFT_1459419 [Suillus spraguei]